MRPIRVCWAGVALTELFMPQPGRDCSKNAKNSAGEAKITKGYDLPAKYVIHTVGPVYGEGAGREAELLANCYKNCLELAREKGIRSVAFPAISTGAYDYPKREAAKIAIQAVKDFLAKNPKSFDEIIFVLIDAENLKIYNELQKNG